MEIGVYLGAEQQGGSEWEKVHRRIFWIDENVYFNLGDGYIVSTFLK